MGLPPLVDGGNLGGHQHLVDSHLPVVIRLVHTHDSVQAIVILLIKSFYS